MSRKSLVSSLYISPGVFLVALPGVVASVVDAIICPNSFTSRSRTTAARDVYCALLANARERQMSIRENSCQPGIAACNCCVLPLLPRSASMSLPLTMLSVHDSLICTARYKVAAFARML